MNFGIVWDLEFVIWDLVKTGCRIEADPAEEQSSLWGKYACVQSPTFLPGSSIEVVHMAGGHVARVRFSAPRKKKM